MKLKSVLILQICDEKKNIFINSLGLKLNMIKIKSEGCSLYKRPSIV